MTTTTQLIPPGTLKDPLWLRIVDRLTIWSARVGAIAAIIMIAQVILDVILRYTLRMGVPGTLDFVTYWWMPILAIMPLALTEYSGQHINADVLTSDLKGSSRIRLLAAINVISLASIGTVLYFAIISAIDSTEKGEHGAVFVWLAVWPIKIIVIIGIALYVLQIISTLFHLFRGERLRTEESEADALFAEAEAEEEEAKK